MEKFTNSTSELVESAQNELLEFRKCTDKQIVITYAEFPHFDNSFAIHLQMAKSGQFVLVKKMWDKLYDLQRFPLGLYNLDRLRIIEDQFELNEIKRLEFAEIINQLQMIDLPESLDNNGIGIDGIQYIFDIQVINIIKQYTWWMVNENIIVFQSLINFLITNTQHDVTNK